MARNYRARLALLALLGLLVAVTSGCQSNDPALTQRLAAQETRVAALEGKVDALQAAQGARPTAAPTPAPLPKVSGLPENGTSKGLDTATVTIVEYSDYL